MRGNALSPFHGIRFMMPCFPSVILDIVMGEGPNTHTLSLNCRCYLSNGRGFVFATPTGHQYLCSEFSSSERESPGMSMLRQAHTM